MSGHGNWRRPSGCANTECVEVAFVGDRVEVGGGQPVADVPGLGPEIVHAPHYIARSYSRAEWAAHVAAVKAGEFDVEALQQ